jgi:hypothetical protein
MNEEEATRRAREADESLARGKDPGRLHGLPILVKDTFETAGLRTTAGAKPLESHIPKKDAAAVARLRAAGALIVGKTNTPEFAGDTQTFNAIAGTTNNPWNEADAGRLHRRCGRLAADSFLELGAISAAPSAPPPTSAVCTATSRAWESFAESPFRPPDHPPPVWCRGTIGAQRAGSSLELRDCWPVPA